MASLFAARHAPLTPTGQVTMMTGHSVEQLAAQAIDGGALGVLHKPFAATQILELRNEEKQAGRVLIADGGADYIDRIVTILEPAGYGVEVAATGSKALERMIQVHVSLRQAG